MKIFTGLFVLAPLCSMSLSTFAQCVNTSTPTCGVYQTCFADRCDCKNSPNEYFIKYGKKYCEVFLNLPTLSDAGKQWRDSTLRCLQEAIVPLLPADGAASSCDCNAMQIKAYDSHVACYTKAGYSICDLPASDWIEIAKSVGPVSSLSDAKGRKQIVEVSKICLPVLAGDAKKSAQKIVDTVPILP